MKSRMKPIKIFKILGVYEFMLLFSLSNHLLIRDPLRFSVKTHLTGTLHFSIRHYTVNSRRFLALNRQNMTIGSVVDHRIIQFTNKSSIIV